MDGPAENTRTDERAIATPERARDQGGDEGGQRINEMSGDFQALIAQWKNLTEMHTVMCNTARLQTARLAAEYLESAHASVHEWKTVEGTFHSKSKAWYVAHIGAQEVPRPEVAASSSVRSQEAEFAVEHHQDDHRHPTYPDGE